MLTLPPHAVILLHRQPVDIRKSFNGLVGLVRSALHAEPVSPTFFVFLNKRHNKIKILYWDADGFAIWYKRLEKGTFHLTLPTSDQQGVQLSRAQLAMLLEGIDFQNTKKRKRFSKKIA